MKPDLEPGRLSAALLDWYDGARRDLPWRAPPGAVADPYAVWLSEIMLQQTTVAAVAPYYQHFLARWPTVEALAAAGLDEVLHAWQGLGYCARARNLHRCARVIAAQHGGRFPDSEQGLRALPGIGPYTAAAVAAIAFGRPATPVDGNVERVMARLHAVTTPLPRAKAELRRLAAELTPVARPGDYAQAVMDLGATVCLPRSPDCARCPWQDACAARAAGIAGGLPRRSPKAARPHRRGVAFWAVSTAGRVLLRRRPEDGLLGGMMEVPTSPWTAAADDEGSALVHAPAPADWQALPGEVSHTFTHFHLTLSVLAARDVAEDGVGPGAVWCRPEDFAGQALPSVMQKVVRHALRGGAAQDRLL